MSTIPPPQEEPDRSRPANLGDALKRLGHVPENRPGVVVFRRRGGTLISVGLIDKEFRVRNVGIWVDPHGATLVDAAGEFRPEKGPSEGYGLANMQAAILDLLAELGRNYLARLELVDTDLAELEQHPLDVPLTDVLRLKKRVSVVRAEVGRTLTAMAEVEGPHVAVPVPGLAVGLPPIKEEMLRLRELTAATQTSLTDILLVKQADQANRLANMANELGKVNNRIAELANISNIRMLGLAYVMLILAVVSTVILFPNTAATILGMPTAGGVPPMVVVIVLAATAVAPMAWFASQKWIRELFRGMARYEARVGEGMVGLKEHVVTNPEPGEVKEDLSPSPKASHGPGEI